MSSLVSWVLAHSTVLAALGVAVLDFVFAVVPGLSGNGLLHQLWVWLQGSSQTPPSS